MKLYLSNKKIKAYSMVELMVTIGLNAVLMLMLSNVLINSISISQRAAARVFIREETSLIVDTITNDIKQSNNIVSCSGEGSLASCVLFTDKIYTWKLCTDDARAICKYTETNQVAFRSSANLSLDLIRFENGFDLTTITNNLARRNLIVTVNTSHRIPGLNVKNIFMQQAVSTRNYLLP